MSLNTYKSKRRLSQALGSILIIILPFLNILRLDIPTLRFYIFNTVLWIDEFHYLFFVVLQVTWLIVFFSMVYGRVWCGWMCPQITLTELVNWMEKKLIRKIRLPKSAKKLSRKYITVYSILYLGIAMFSLLVSFNLVSYFVDPYRMLSEIAAFELGSITAWFIISIAALLFVDLVFWKENFCTKTCPYGMMQVVVTDKFSQIVRYDTERNDDCIDCKACVRDCIMGIDIRTSPYQTECIHCGDCVDSCERILSKKNIPNLISFSWGEQASKRKWFEKIGLVDGKRKFLLALLTVFTAGMIFSINMRQPLAVSVTGDRSTLFHIGENGSIVNDFSLRITNRSIEDNTFRVKYSNDINKEECQLLFEDNPVFLKSGESKKIKFSVATMGKNLKSGPNKLFLVTEDVNNPKVSIQTEIVFFAPEDQ